MSSLIHLLRHFLERILSDALEEHYGKVCKDGRTITNLRFADAIDTLAEKEQELESIVKISTNLHKV